MDETLKEKLKYLAEQEQRSLSSQVRHLIRLYFQEYESKYGPIETKGPVAK
ncbi:Arc family DNA-binding protein [Intestinimonas butyriciproducens]|nr:Arc family DNA-binding protein [Intestinimonas butyriciproducens]